MCDLLTHTKPSVAPHVEPEGQVVETDHAKKPDIKADGDTTFKTNLCRNFETTGKCRYDRLCMYAHGNAELRTSEMNVRDGLITPSAIRTYQMSTENRFGNLYAEQANGGPTAPKGGTILPMSPPCVPFAAPLLPQGQGQYGLPKSPPLLPYACITPPLGTLPTTTTTPMSMPLPMQVPLNKAGLPTYPLDGLIPIAYLAANPPVLYKGAAEGNADGSIQGKQHAQPLDKDKKAKHAACSTLQWYNFTPAARRELDAGPIVPSMPAGHIQVSPPMERNARSFDMIDGDSQRGVTLPAGIVMLRTDSRSSAVGGTPKTAPVSMMHTPQHANRSVTPPVSEHQSQAANNRDDAAAGASKTEQNTTFKTNLCRNFETKGKCPYERLCMYAHGNAELRTGEMNVRDGLTTPNAIRAHQMSMEAGSTTGKMSPSAPGMMQLSPGLVASVNTNVTPPTMPLGMPQQQQVLVRPVSPQPWVSAQPSPAATRCITPPPAAALMPLAASKSTLNPNSTSWAPGNGEVVASVQPTTVAPALRRMPTVGAVVSKPMTRDNNSFDMIDGSSSSPVKGASEAPRSHKEALEGHLEYAECPADLKWNQSTSEALAAAAGAHGTVVVLSDLRSGTMAAEVRWMLKSAAGVEVVKAEPKGPGTFTVSLATAAGVHTVRALDGRLLCDREGFWLARTGDEINFLEEYTSTKLAQGAGGLPKSCLTVVVDRRRKK